MILIINSGLDYACYYDHYYKVNFTFRDHIVIIFFGKEIYQYFQAYTSNMNVYVFPIIAPTPLNWIGDRGNISVARGGRSRTQLIFGVP
jgi:hypothetical protein